MKDGVLVGVLLVASLINPAIGLPVIAAYFLISTTREGPVMSRDDVWLFGLICTKIFWLITIFQTYGGTSPAAFLQVIGIELILLLTLMIRRREDFFRGLSVPIFGLLAADAAFNAWTLVFDVDPFGRTYGARPDDYLPRLGGLFFHSFYSINISLVAMLFAVYLRKRAFTSIAILNVVANGSYRGVLTLLVIAAVYFLLKTRRRFPTIVLCGVTIAAGVFATTYYSIEYLGDESANYIRVFAWLNALSMIADNPWIGFHSFAAEPIEHISEETIAAHGVAESVYLQYALHFGVVPSILHLVFLLSVLRRSLRELYWPRTGSSDRFKMIAAIFASVAFVDSFYGTFIGGAFTTMCFGLFALSGRHLRPWPTPPAANLQLTRP